MKMVANERLYGYGVATCEWNGGDKGESGCYLKTFWRPNIPPARVIACPHANIALIPLIWSQRLCFWMSLAYIICT